MRSQPFPEIQKDNVDFASCTLLNIKEQSNGSCKTITRTKVRIYPSGYVQSQYIYLYSLTELHLFLYK